MRILERFCIMHHPARAVPSVGRSYLISLQVRMTSDPSSDGGGYQASARSGLWQQAYRKYHRFWVALAQSGHYAEAEAEEMLHAVLIAAMEDSGKHFDSLEHIRNYIARALLNRIIERRKNVPRYTEWDDESERGSLEDEEMSAHERHELRLALRMGMRKLPAPLYRIVKLRFFSGFSFQEMSEYLELPISTIKSREDVALRKIRRILELHGF